MLPFAERINTKYQSPLWSGRTRTDIHHSRSSGTGVLFADGRTATAPSSPFTAVLMSQSYKSMLYFIKPKITNHNVSGVIFFSKPKIVASCDGIDLNLFTQVLF